MMYYIHTIYYLFKYIYHRIFTPFYKIGWPVVFSRGVQIVNSRYIQIGNKVFINKDAFIQVEPYHHLEFGNHKPKLKIGNNVGIGRGVTICAVSDVEIEDNVMIAAHSFISDNSHGFDKIDIPIRYQGLNNVRPIKIRNGSWLGWNSVIMPGVTIGKNSVIGANSVVTKDIPDYCVAVGSPAKIVKKYDSSSKKWIRV